MPLRCCVTFFLLLCVMWAGGSAMAQAPGNAAGPQTVLASVQAVTPGSAQASVQPMDQAGKDLALGRKYLLAGRGRLAVQYLSLAVKTYEKQPPSLDQYTAYSDYANALGLEDEHNLALNYHFKAEQTAKALRSNAKQAEALAAVGQDLIQLHDYGQAGLYLRKAADLFLALFDQKHAAKCLSDVGDCYMAKTQYSRAAENFRRSLKLFTAVADLPSQVSLHERLSRALFEQRYFTSAINELQTTLKLADSAKLPEEKTAAYLDLSECYGGTADEETKSVFYGNIGLALAQRYKNLPLQERANLLLSSAYTRQNEHAKALRHYKSYVVLRDRITNDARSRQLAEMRLRYENEKSGKEIAVLTRERRIQELDLERKGNLIWASLGAIALLAVAALLLHRKNLSEKSANTRLHETNIKIEQQRDQIDAQKAGLKEALGQLESSISYAKRIQDAVLSASAPLRPDFADPLIYFRPKAIVSGDFYWAAHEGDETVVVVADCTGHGVPGAFMSLVGQATLVRAIAAIPSLDPASILAYIDHEIANTLGNQPGLDIKEGIEMSVCILNRKSRALRFAGARRDALMVSTDAVKILPGSRRSVGGVYASQAPEGWTFTTKQSLLPPHCGLYLCSDGYADQHGADGKSKFGLPRLRSLLQDCCHLPASSQAIRLDSEFEEWRGTTEQTDDILIVSLSIG